MLWLTNWWNLGKTKVGVLLITLADTKITCSKEKIKQKSFVTGGKLRPFVP